MQFRDGVSASARNAIESAYSLAPLTTYGEGIVQFAEPDFLIEKRTLVAPLAPTDFFSDRWHLHGARGAQPLRRNR